MKCFLKPVFLLVALLAARAAVAAQLTHVAPAIAPRHLTVFQGHLYFDAQDSKGRELWRYDGTIASRVTDINPGSGTSIPWDGSTNTLYRTFTEFNDALYFRAAASGADYDLWRYNGSAASRAAELPDVQYDYYPHYLQSFNGALYFQSADSPTGSELWKYNGLSAFMAVDLRTGTNGSYPSLLTPMGNQLYLFAKSSDTASSRPHLWQYDGTVASEVSDLSQIAQLGSFQMVGDAIAYGGELLFTTGYDSNSIRQLWKYDGSSVSLVKAFGAVASRPGSLAIFQGELYFRASDFTGNGMELWKYDGSTASLAADVLAGSQGSAPLDLTVLNDELYFLGYDGSTGYDLWKFDGTSASLAADLEPWNDYYDNHLAAYNGELYLANAYPSGPPQLWKYTPDVVPEPHPIASILVGFGVAFSAVLWSRRKIGCRPAARERAALS